MNCWLLCHLFSLCVAWEGFFPPSPFFLLSGASSQHVRNLAAGRASKLVCAESFFGGSCWDGGAWCPASLKKIIVCHLWVQTHDFLCIAVKKGCWVCKRQVKHKNWFVLSLFWGESCWESCWQTWCPASLNKITVCHCSESKRTIVFVCVVKNGGGVGIVDGYVPAKDIIPKNPYRVFLRYWLVKYRENIPTDTKPKYRIKMQLYNNCTGHCSMQSWRISRYRLGGASNTCCAWAGGTCVNNPDFCENLQFHVIYYVTIAYVLFWRISDSWFTWIHDFKE